MTNGSSSKKPARLGRGLSALVGSTPPVRVETNQTKTTHTTGVVDPGSAGSGLLSLGVGEIRPNPHQPRRSFDEASLATLATSIGRDGLMQPVVVRRAADGGYELVAGERRLRASKLAGLERIHAILREADDRTSAELALIENLQRADLNPVERARAFKALIERHGLTQAELGERVGMDRASVSNHLRLLDLDDDLLGMVADGRLGFGHARALLAVGDPAERRRLAELICEESWSVRATERAAADWADRLPVNASNNNECEVNTSHNATPSDVSRTRARAVLDDMERRLSEHLGTRVTLRTDRSGQKGSVTLEFFSLDQFDGILERLGYRHDVS
ncbi:MAG: ParB/RepB/Spo0J family partition protein [Phycisphaerales bacterium]|nr:ParB/RepB/Spo0J family partition protein [Planctomycetota bacterium]MCH8508040.1 ParB/RepB/Spo0J family partition protein [Phycisphaerales bacterium]